MVTVENIRNIVASGNGAHQAVLDITVSTTAELPAMGAVVGGMAIKPASIAYIIQADKWCTLDDDSKWYSGGEEVS